MKAKIKVIEYDEKGNYIRGFQSAQAAQMEYYNGTKFPLWAKHSDIHFLPNGNFLTKGHVGRDYIMQECKKMNDPYKIKKRGGINEKQVEVYNLSGELVATFVNSYIAGLMLNIDPATIQYRCKHESKEYHGEPKLHFKFKQL